MPSVHNETVAWVSEQISTFHSTNNTKGITSLILKSPIHVLVDAVEQIANINVFLFVLECASDGKLSETFLSFTWTNKIRIIEYISVRILSRLMMELNADDAALILDDLPHRLHRKVILSSPSQLRKELKEIGNYNPSYVGSIMNNTTVWLYSSMTVYVALQHLKSKKDEYDIEKQIFVLNQDHVAIGQVRSNDLFLFKDKKYLVESMMDKSFVGVSDETNIDEVIDLFNTHNLSVVCVYSHANQVALGIVSAEDIVPEIIEENSRILNKIHGIQETELPYMSSTYMTIAKSRIFWLIIMLFTSTFTTLVIDQFTRLGGTWTAGISSSLLIPIIPVITGICGNSGGQTISTVIQSLAKNEISAKDFWAVAKKELKVSYVIGLVLSIFNFVRLLIYFIVFKIDTASVKLQTSATIDDNKMLIVGIIGAATSSITLFLVVILSKFMGVLIPFIIIKCKKDPAVISLPILTTLLDTVGAVVFFTIGIFAIYGSIIGVLGKTITDGKLSV